MQGKRNDLEKRERRIDELEKEYEAAHSDPENQKKLEELYFQLSGLIGKNNRHYLQKYTDRLIARYNIDPGWFYRKGLEDAGRPLLSARPAAYRAAGHFRNRAYKCQTKGERRAKRRFPMENTARFTGKADIYSQYRPGYPLAYIEYLTQANHLRADSVMADIGSGTGKLTGQLLELGGLVMAVEPNADMRHMAEEKLGRYPNFRSVAGTAESTGIGKESVDLVTVAQAFHWFDLEKFRRECRRILKPGRNVSLVWNSRDESSRLVRENAEICREFCPSFAGFSGGRQHDPSSFRRFFQDGEPDSRIFPYDLTYDRDGFIGRNLSASYAPSQADGAYSLFVRALTRLFAKYSRDGILVMPNVTRSYTGRVA